MSLVYADTSSLARAHLPDEPGHDRLLRLLRSGEATVVTSEITRIEFARAARGAGRAGRLRRWRVTIERFEHDCRPGGPITLILLRPDAILPIARDLVIQHPVGTLDAIHLAVALVDLPEIAAGDEIVFVTRDANQAKAARKLGLRVA